jgi:hypothetical protein
MSHRTSATRLAWSMCAVSLMLTITGLVLLVVSRFSLGDRLYAGNPVYYLWLVNTMVAFSFSTVGGMITPRLPAHNPVGWLFCTIGLLAGMRLFVAEYAIVTLLAESGTPLSGLPGGEALAWVSSWLWVSHIGLFLFLALLFAEGRLPSSRWRPFAWVVAMVIVVGTVAVAVWPKTAAGFDLTNHPLGIETATDQVNPVEIILYTLALVAMSSLVVRLRRSEGIERQQVKWFAYAVLVLAISAILEYVVFEPTGIGWLGGIGSVLVIAGVVGLPIAVGIAALRYRLYDIDLIINRTLVYGSLTAMLVALYFGVIVLLQRVFVVYTGELSTLAIVASTLLIAALFNPLRRRIQSFIDRSFYRRKYDAAKTLEGFSMRLRDETDLEALRGDLVGMVRETMQPAHVSLWLRPLTDLGRSKEQPR